MIGVGVNGAGALSPAKAFPARSDISLRAGILEYSFW